MREQDIRLIFICYRILPRLRTTGIPAKYCFHIAKLKELIEKNKQHRIILVCKSKHARKLKDIMIERYIHEIFILGHCSELNIIHKEITIINTNEQDLIFHILCAAIRYTHREELTHRQLENNGLADALAMDVIKLVNQIENLL
jgi:hypothetical protein